MTIVSNASKSAVACELATFDVYTALFDVEGSLVPLVGRVCPAVDPLALVRAWRSKQLEYAQVVNSLQRGRVPFRVVTRRALDYTFKRAGQDLAHADAQALCAAWDALRPWPEAASVLTQLKARGYALGVLSNGDEDMLRAVLTGLDVPFDHVLASDHAGWYKPHPAIYGLPVTRLHRDVATVLHVAGSAIDVLGCKSAGLACAWSNRQGDPLLDPEVRPDFEMRDLEGLLAILPRR